HLAGMQQPDRRHPPPPREFYAGPEGKRGTLLGFPLVTEGKRGTLLGFPLVTEGKRGTRATVPLHKRKKGVAVRAYWKPPTKDGVEGYFKELNNWGRWGHDAQRGTANLITPAKRAQAAALVRSGRTVSLARGAGPQPALLH